MGRIYLDTNGITVKCEGCEVGFIGILNGEEYEVVDNNLLRSCINRSYINYRRLDRLVTTLVTDMRILFSFSDLNQPIGNWDVSSVTDMFGMFYRSKFNQPIDASFINFGGIRLQAIPAGNITRGKLFELAPFDNVIVLQKIKGKVFQQFLNHISSRGGWPTAGMTWQIKNKEAINVLIGRKPLLETSTYTIALVDYVANGGDDCEMLKSISQINNGILFRDAIIAYFSSFTKQGKKIPAITEKRVSNAN